MTQSANAPKRTHQIGVVGAGLIGRKHIGIAAAANALHAIVDPTAAARELAAEKSCLWIPDIDTYLANHAPDGVIMRSTSTNERRKFPLAKANESAPHSAAAKEQLKRPADGRPPAPF